MPFPAVHPALDRALVNKGYAEPTPVQAAVLEGEYAERDLLVSAQTGSGKTVAFGLAAAPTRELAMQVAAELQWLYADSGAKIATCVGGMDARREARALGFGVHIVVGTPGRLKDHIDRGNLDLSELKVAVLDEADEMLDMGFREDLEFILDHAPAERRTLLFSATIAREIVTLAKRYQKDAVRIDATDKSRQHADIEYRAYRIAPNEIEHAVVNTLRWFEMPRAMVFCSTRDSVRHLQASLLERGFSTVSLSGEMGQRERTDALQALRDGRARVCVATDVAARGLDLPDLGLVIHAELPMNRAGLLHRSGRTGRAGTKGGSVMLVPHSPRRKPQRLMDEAGIDAVWSGAPTFDEIRKADEGRLLSPEFFEADVSDEDMIVAKRMIAERTPDEIAAALVRLLRKEQPAPEELSDPGSDRSPVKRERTVRNEDGTAAQPWPGDRLGADDVVWFRLDVGRNKNADPKWLIPLICRIGGISKPQIGAIRTFPEETRFEIAKTHEKAFREAVAASNDEVKITSSEAPTPGSMKAGKFAGAGKPRREDGDRPFKKTPYKRADGGEGDARPPFKKKPWAPKADAGGENPRSNAAGDKPFAKKQIGRASCRERG